MANILLIDDNQELLELLSWDLESFGHHPIIAINIESAKRALETEKVDLIISDYTLAGNDPTGYFSSLVKLAQAPILIITGYNISRSNQLELQDLGVKSIISKPWKVDYLADNLKEILHT